MNYNVWIEDMILLLVIIIIKITKMINMIIILMISYDYLTLLRVFNRLSSIWKYYLFAMFLFFVNLVLNGFVSLIIGHAVNNTFLYFSSFVQWLSTIVIAISYFVTLPQLN